MLTLTRFRDVSDCRVFRDDLDPLTLYAIAFAPRIALDEDGKPIISLVRYRRDVSKLSEEERKTRLGGGILTLSAELRVSDEQQKAIRAAAASDPELKQLLSRQRPQWWNTEIKGDEKKLAAAFNLAMVPVKDGTVQIAILGETQDASGEFIGSLVGVGRVSMLGNMRASFMAKLTQDGSVLLWDMLEKNLAAIRIAYDLKYDHRLDAVKMVVWCDAGKSYNVVHEMWQSLQENASYSTKVSGGSTSRSYGHDQSQQAGETLSKIANANQFSSVTITPEADSSVVPPTQIEQLTKVGNDMISQFLASTILEFKPDQGDQAQQPDLKTELPRGSEDRKYGHDGIQSYSLKKEDESIHAVLNSVFTSKAVLEGTLGPNDNLSNILKGQKVDQFRTEIDLNDAFYQFQDVMVVCTSNFDEDPVDLVEAHLSYQATGPQGPINSAKDFVFKKDSAPQVFSTYLASPDKRAYDYEYTVYYRGTGATMTGKGKSDETVLVLDTDRMGILRVGIEVGLIDWDRIRTAFVKMSYGSGPTAKGVELTLNQQQTKQLWVEVIGQEVKAPYRYSVTFVDKDNRKIEVPEQTSTNKTLIISQPLQQALEVALIPAGEFGAEGLISKIAVALRYRDAANKYDADEIFVLNDSKTSQFWNVPLVDPNVRTYEYQTTVFYSDGVTRTDDWKPTDEKVLPVGDPYGFRVQVNARLLKGFAFGTIHLVFDDAGPPQIHAEKTIEIDDFTKPLFWRFRLNAPGRHKYRYTASLFKDDGTEVKIPESEADQEVLVLKPS